MEFFYQDSSQLPADDITDAALSLSAYGKKVRDIAESGGYEHPECSINAPVDRSLYSEAQLMVQEKGSSRLRYIIVVGIGGSNLGTQAIYEALYGRYDLLRPGRFPKCIFLDTTDAAFMAQLKQFLIESVSSPDEVLINIISKSGATTETIVNAEIVIDALQKQFGSILDRTVVTTDYGSPLWERAQDMNISRLGIPACMGGRYSVFSPVGMFPLLLAGIDTDRIREGALVARQACLREPLENPAMLSAAVQFLHTKAGVAISNLFLFNPALEYVGRWYRQLLAESVGKEKDRQGKTVRAGLTPTVSIGSTDLHSIGQLYFGGPRDKVTTFVWNRRSVDAGDVIPQGRVFPELVPEIEGKSISGVLQAILEGTKKAYQEQGMPFMEVVLDDISEHSLGEFMQFKMYEVIYLAQLYDVNAFDQPSVETYKKTTRQLLEKK